MVKSVVILLVLFLPAFAQVDTLLCLTGSEMLQNWLHTSGWVIQDESAFIHYYENPGYDFSHSEDDQITGYYIQLPEQFDSLLVKVDTYWWGYTSVSLGSEHAKLESWLYFDFGQQWTVNPWYINSESGKGSVLPHH